MKTSPFFLLLAGLCLLIPLPTQAQDASTLAKAVKNMEWRPIGPANMGGRVTDIVGIPGDPSTFYVAGADGGVFKTTNAGTTFKDLFTNEKSYSVGALALAPSDHNVIWLGSGEGDPRNSVGYGHGMYRSLNGGETWQHIGLDRTERIKRIVVHPNNPDVALVCALGREWGPNVERGVFRTTDGGQTWEHVLAINEDTGCSDLAMEDANPRILYAGMWTFRRQPWRFDDGGHETALYRSMDGGTTWETIMNGLPNKPMARIGVAVAQSQPETVYLITEFKDGGTLFRSDNRGKSWRLVNDDPNINFRPFYYSDMRVDPTNPDILYALSGGLFKSTDGGKNFDRIARGVHGDHQSFWIDPMNNRRLLSGSDGGYQVSFDQGATFDIINNVELSQYYQLYVDDSDPYQVCGGLQDNGTWCGPHRTLNTTGIMKRHWTAIAGGDGYYALPIPGKEHMVYANLQGGVIFLVDTRMGNVRNIHPYPKITGSAGDAIVDHKYRFNWDSPILISPHDPNTVYFGGNVLFKTTNEGQSWEEISPDLTTADETKQLTSGGEIYQDNTAAEFHTTILTIAESPIEEGVIWVGTDDGNVQLTRDGGQTWTNLKDRIRDLPAFAWVAKIHASEHDAGTAFVAVDQHRSDDFTPHAFMTTNYGRTWTTISNGLPQDDYVKVVRQDPSNPDVLYAGMEHGIYASWDKGQTWASIRNNMPPVSVRDLRVQAREGDLIVGTHGRGVWILDDIRPIQNLVAAQDKPVHMYEPRQATRWHLNSRMENLGQRTYVADNPDYGAYINFALDEKPEGPALVTIFSEDGESVRTLTDSTLSPGVNRIVWDLRHEGPTALADAPTGGFNFGSSGPLAMPGMYTASLEVAGEEHSATFNVRADPRVEMNEDGYMMQDEAVRMLVDMQSKVHELINNTTVVRKQLLDVKQKLEHAGEDEGLAFSESPQFSLTEAIEDIDVTLEELKLFRNELLRPPPSMTYRQRPRLREEVRSLMRAISSATAPPTDSQMLRIEELEDEMLGAMGEFDRIMNTRVEVINEALKEMPQVLIGTAGR